MAHFPKPFFRPSRGLWYVQIGGKQVKLGPDRDQAFRRYHELMATPEPAIVSLHSPAVVTVLDAYLDWCQKNKAKRTYDWYRDYLQSFTETIPPVLSIRELKPHHVQSWIDRHPGWKTGKRGAIIAVQRALNWAVKFGHVTESPIQHMEKPAQGRREQLVTPEEFAAVLKLVRDPEFIDLIVTSWETGCRPHEIFSVEARHFDGDRWVFPKEESKGKKTQRVVYLTDKALAITKRLIEKQPTGPLFRNTDGIPWTMFSVNCRFRRLAEKVGVKYSLYSFRHSWCTRALENGIDAVTVAILMGHKDVSMVARVYSHLNQRKDYLQESIRKISPGDASA